MTTRQQNFVAIAKTALTVLSQHEATWKTNKRFKRSVDDIRTILAEIEARQQGGITQTVAATSQKHDAADNAAELAAKIAKRVKVHAADENNLDLKQKMSFSASDYHHMTDADLSAQIQNLISAVKPIVALLTDYGVSADMIDTLEDLIYDFKTLESQPRAILTARKMHNAAIPELIKILRTDLQSLDSLISIFDDDNLENQFKNSRMIIDRGIRHNHNDDNEENPPTDQP